MDRVASQIPAACCCPQGSLPRQVYRGSQAGLPKREAWLSWHATAARPAEGICGPDSANIPQRLGRLLQAAIRRSRARAALSRLLYAPGRHLESSAGLTGRWQGHLPVARLSSQEQKAPDDHLSGRVPPPLSPACTTDEVRSHSPLRYSQHTPSVCSASAVSTAHRREPSAARAARCTTAACDPIRRPVAMSNLRWTDAVARAFDAGSAAASVAASSFRCGRRMKPQPKPPRVSSTQSATVLVCPAASARSQRLLPLPSSYHRFGSTSRPEHPLTIENP